MEHKGEIGQGGFPEILRELEKSKSTGLLTVEASHGARELEIRADTVAIANDVEAKYNLGDLLVAQGRITSRQLVEALRTQRQLNQRLGDVLCMMEAITQEGIEEALAVQMREEISELLTLGEGRYLFHDGKKLSAEGDGQPPEPGSGSSTPGGSGTRLKEITLPLGAFIAESLLHFKTWAKLQETIPSPHQSFRLTEQGEGRLEGADGALKRFLQLLREGYDVAGITHRTLRARFTVYEQLAELLKVGDIEPVREAELKERAEGFLTDRKREQALGCYRRLLELEGDSEARKTLEYTIKKLEEPQEASAKPASVAQRSDGDGPHAETPPAPSDHAGQPERPVSVFELAGEDHPKRSARPGWGPLIGTIVVVAALAGLSQLDSVQRVLHPESPAAFKEAQRRSGALKNIGFLEEALTVYDQFLSEKPESTFVPQVEEEANGLRSYIETEIDLKLRRTEELIGRKKFDEAIKTLRYLKARFRGNWFRLREINEKIRSTRVAQVAYLQIDKVARLAVRVEKARSLQKERSYHEALYNVEKVIASPLATPDLRRRAEALRASIKLNQLQARLETAKTQQERGRYSDALKQFEAIVASPFASEPVRQEAAALAKSIDALAQQAEKQYRAGLALEKAFKLKQAALAYAEARKIYRLGDWGRKAKNALADILRRRRDALGLYQQAADLEKTDTPKAIGRHRQILWRYKGTEAAAKAAKRLKALGQTAEAAPASVVTQLPLEQGTQDIRKRIEAKEDVLPDMLALLLRDPDMRRIRDDQILPILAELGDSRAAEALGEYLRGNRNALLKGRALAALKRIGGESVLPALWERLADAERPVRRHAARVLGAILAKSNIPSLPSRIHDRVQGLNAEVQVQAAEVLAALPPPQARSLLFAFAKEGKPEARTAFVRALASSRHAKGAYRELLELATTSGTQVRREAIRGLSRAGGADERIGTELVPHLIAMLEDSEPPVRQAALQALRSITREALGASQWSAWLKQGGLKADDRLKQAANKLGARDVASRLRAISALRGLAGRRRLEVEAALLAHLGDSKPRVRAALVQALGNVGTNRSVKPLIDRLADPRPEVVAAAHAGLLRLSGKRFPADRDTWLTWWRASSQ